MTEDSVGPDEQLLAAMDHHPDYWRLPVASSVCPPGRVRGSFAPWPQYRPPVFPKHWNIKICVFFYCYNSPPWPQTTTHEIKSVWIIRATCRSTLTIREAKQYLLS
jgi:hypothetical protein